MVPFSAPSEVAGGINFEARYIIALGNDSLELRPLVNHADRLDIIASGLAISRAGEVGDNLDRERAQDVPRIRALAPQLLTMPTVSPLR